jgi:hypothetical protein
MRFHAVLLQLICIYNKSFRKFIALVFMAFASKAPSEALAICWGTPEFAIPSSVIRFPNCHDVHPAV